MEGFFVPPKVDNGKMTIAFTKVGKKAGEQGTTALSTIIFKGKNKLFELIKETVGQGRGRTTRYLCDFTSCLARDTTTTYKL